MRVPALQTTTPADSQKAVVEAASGESQHFSRLLDEKKERSASYNPAAGAGLPEVRFRSTPQRVTKSTAEKPADEATEAQTQDTDAALLTLLNQCQATIPQDEGARKAKLTLAEKSDALPAENTVAPADNAMMPAALPTSDTPPVSGTSPSAVIQAVTPEAATAVQMPETGTKAASEPAQSASMRTAQSGVKPGALHPAQQAADAPAEASAATTPATTPATPSPEIATLKGDSLQRADNAMPVKEAMSAKGEAQGTLSPELPLTPLRITPTASDPGAVHSPATGLLTQEMGTPAWQQSLGQQVACFTRNGIQHAELRLHPKELGSLQISLQLKNDQAELHFVSASHQVRAAIEAAVPHLRTSLAESGIELGQSSVGADMTQDGKHSDPSGQSFQPQGSHPQPDDHHASAEEPVEAVIRTVSYRNGINTFA